MKVHFIVLYVRYKYVNFHAFLLMVEHKERHVRLFNDADSSGGGDTIKRKAESKIQLFFHYLLYVYCITRLSKASEITPTFTYYLLL